MPPTPVLARLAVMLGVDGRPLARPPSPRRAAAAALVALAGSLLADALLVKLGTTLFPGTRGFSHFRSLDYGLLTTLGVGVAAAWWPVVARLSSQPRRSYRRLAVASTIVLWLPDGWLLLRGEPVRAVGVLMVMHLAIALVTYHSVVRLAPASGAPRPAATGAVLPAGASGPLPRSVWVAMTTAIGVEFLAGVGVLLVVPTSRPSGALPSAGRGVYLIHGAVGAVLGLAALSLLLWCRAGVRAELRAALGGAIGLAVAGGGGVLTVDHGLRLLGMGIMLVGSVVAGMAYLMPLVEPGPSAAAGPSPDEVTAGSRGAP